MTTISWPSSGVAPYGETGPSIKEVVGEPGVAAAFSQNYSNENREVISIVKEPESMAELVYFTQRAVGSGYVKAWVYKGLCPKCKKSKMGKPIDEKTKKPKIRAKEYVCPSCGYSEEKKAHEETLFCEVKYTCPQCKFVGETTVPYKRKKFDGMDAIIFLCEKCKTKIPITKKLKEKGTADAGDDE